MNLPIFTVKTGNGGCISWSLAIEHSELVENENSTFYIQTGIYIIWEHLKKEGITKGITKRNNERPEKVSSTFLIHWRKSEKLLEVMCFSCTCVVRDTFSPTYLIHQYTANYFSARLYKYIRLQSRYVIISISFRLVLGYSTN